MVCIHPHQANGMVMLFNYWLIHNRLQNKQYFTDQVQLTTSTIFKMPKYDLRYSVSHLMPPSTFLACTGSVVGWYGLLAPEIMEVLEASPSKPSVSSVFLMFSFCSYSAMTDIKNNLIWI